MDTIVNDTNTERCDFAVEYSLYQGWLHYLVRITEENAMV